MSDLMTTTTPHWKTTLRFVLLCSFAVATASGCGIVKNVEEEDDSFLQMYNLTSNVTSNVSNCAQNAFRVAVHPSLASKCSGCHGAAQGSTNVAVAYVAVKARVSFSNPSNSSLVRKVSDPNHCTGCGTDFANATATRIGIWAKAEQGDAATCAEYANAPDSGGASVKPFDLGSYTPPNPNDTIIVAAGLAEFQSANGPFQSLVTNCQGCHIPGGLSYFAPFAINNANNSYRESKPRTNFMNVDASILLQKASVVNHGGGCVICGNPAFTADLRAKLLNWAVMENAAVTSSQVVLSEQTITTTATNTANPQVLEWNLGNTVTPADALLAGALFRLDVTVSASSPSTYRFNNPRLVLPASGSGGHSIRVKKLTFILENVPQTTMSSYFSIDTMATVGTSQVTKQLATFPALVSNPNGAANSNPGTKIKIQFDLLQGQP